MYRIKAAGRIYFINYFYLIFKNSPFYAINKYSFLKYALRNNSSSGAELT